MASASRTCRRRVVDVAVLDELPERLGPGVPVAGVRQQDDVVAVPALPRSERGVLRPAEIEPLRGAVRALHEEALGRVARAPPVEGDPVVGVAEVEPLHRQVEAAVVDVLLQRDLEEREVVRRHRQLHERLHAPAGQLQPGGRPVGARRETEHLREHHLRDVAVAVVADPGAEQQSVVRWRERQLHVDVELEMVRPQPVVREPKGAVLGLDQGPCAAALEVVRGVVVERDGQPQDAARAGRVDVGPGRRGDRR